LRQKDAHFDNKRLEGYKLISRKEKKNMAKFYPSIILRHQVLLYLNFFFSVEAIFGVLEEKN
jgi:hypothetical protein